MMKESIKNCFENADVEQLNGFFEKYKREQMTEESLARLREKMLGEGAKKPAKKRGFKRLIPALAAAACLLIGLGAAYKAGAFNKPNSGVPHKPDTMQSANMGNGEAMKLEVITNTKDKLDIRSLPDGASQSVQADRDYYRQIRFFEYEEKVYAITGEVSGMFSFDGDSFTRIFSSLSDILYFAGDVYNGCIYMPGNWYCWGRDSGLYRFDLKTGKVERFVSTDEIVVSVAADGPNIYYSSHTGSDRTRYSLKCVNAETGEISVLIQNASYYITDLKCKNGNIYFRSYYKGVFYITPDMYLHRVGAVAGENNYVGGYDVNGDIIYTSTYLYDGYNAYVLEAFDHSGKRLAGYEAQRYLGDEKTLPYINFTEFTIYNGRFVCYDENGAYLLDIASGEREIIMDRAWPEDHSQSNPYQAVFNGKLYLCIMDTVYEYYDGAVKEYDLSTAEYEND